jgi:membrane-associated protein
MSKLAVELDRCRMTASDPPQPPGPPGEAKGTGAAARLSRWFPWHGRPRARDVVCASMIAVSAIYAVVTIPLTPMLIATHPVLLEALTGSTPSVMAAGAFSDVDSKMQIVVVFVAALPGMMRFDWVYWWAGRLWGHSVVEKLGQRSPRSAALARIAETRGRRYAGPLVALAAFLPDGASTAVYAAVGWTGLPLLWFVFFDTIGSAAWTALLAACGYWLGSDGVALANLVSRYAFVSICVIVAGLVAPHVWHSWRDRRAGKLRPGQAAPAAASPSGAVVDGPGGAELP